MNKYLTKTPIVILLAIFCCALWGSAFPSIKIGYQLFHIQANATNQQLLFAGMRFFLAGILVIVTASASSRTLLIPKNRTTLYKIIMLAFVQTVLQYIFFYIGLANTTGSKAAIVESMNVFFSVLVSVIIFRMEQLTITKILGCLIGFVGVVLVNLGDGISSFNLTGDGFILISTIAYAFSSVMIKHFSSEDNPVLLSGYQFMVGGLVLIVTGFALGGRITPPSISALLMLFYLAFISAAAYTIWGILLKYNPVSKVTVFGFSNPMFGFILSALFLKETKEMGIRFILALILVCMGIIIVNLKPNALFLNKRPTKN
jgi:drug/metabolite transporter (DMT)-like permease